MSIEEINAIIVKHFFQGLTNAETTTSISLCLLLPAVFQNCVYISSTEIYACSV